MKPTRRDLITLGAGAVVALPFTPLPWKLLDDSAIWTQNWPWIPTPQGRTVRQILGLRAMPGRLRPEGPLRVGGRPVGIAPVANHPVSRGGLCAMAFGAQLQLPWHPQRLKAPQLRGHDESLEKVHAEVASELQRAGNRVAILDARPGHHLGALPAVPPGTWQRTLPDGAACR